MKNIFKVKAKIEMQVLNFQMVIIKAKNESTGRAE
jgi:hypothetical protein